MALEHVFGRIDHHGLCEGAIHGDMYGQSYFLAGESVVHCAVNVVLDAPVLVGNLSHSIAYKCVLESF